MVGQRRLMGISLRKSAQPQKENFNVMSDLFKVHSEAYTSLCSFITAIIASNSNTDCNH